MSNPDSRLVREIARGAHGTCAMIDLLELAMERKKEWRADEWRDLLERLDKSDLTLKQFRESLQEWI